jgi:hypothetical protein
MYTELQVAMASVFLASLLTLIVPFLVGVLLLLWWLIRTKKRKSYIAIFALSFLYLTYVSWGALSATSFVQMTLLGAWTSLISSIALWRAASKGKKLWFIALALFGYLGILPAVYVWGIEKMKTDEWYK